MKNIVNDARRNYKCLRVVSIVFFAIAAAMLIMSVLLLFPIFTSGEASDGTVVEFGSIVQKIDTDGVPEKNIRIFKALENFEFTVVVGFLGLLFWQLMKLNKDVYEVGPFGSRITKNITKYLCISAVSIFFVVLYPVFLEQMAFRLLNLNEIMTTKPLLSCSMNNNVSTFIYFAVAAAGLIQTAKTVITYGAKLQKESDETL